MFSQRVFRFVLLTAMSALILTAQTGSGTVQGVVRDASSAVVAGATVTMVNTTTMVKFSTTANGVGFFVFPPVQPGSYEITATSPGMETWKGSFLLAVGQTTEISPVLKVGVVTTQVTIGDAAPLVSTSDATISRNLEHARIEQLPVDGRSISNLVLTSTPSLVGGQDGAINPIDTGLRDAVELYQDGAVKKNRDVGDWAGRLPGVDSVQELRVETSLSSAQFDRPGSVMLSTKSGTNNLHGSLFETNRNSAVGVARRRQDYYTKAPHYVRNEFGGSVGGPVFIPKVYNGKNRTFFFTSYELLRQVSASTASTTMPTDAMRNGNYSGLVDSLGRQTVIYDPLSTGPGPTWTRTPFPNNTIPTVRESPNAKYLYSIMPEPTFPNVNPNIGNNYFGLLSNATSDSMSTSRIDHRIGDRDQVFGRFSVDRDHNTYQTNSVPALSGPLNYVYNYYGDNSAVASWTHTFSPVFLSDTQVSYSHEYKFTGSPSDPNIKNMADYLNMPNLGNDPLTAYQTSGMGFGVNFSMQQARQNTSNIFVVDQNFTRMFGHHQLQFGGRLHLEYLNVSIDQPTSTISYDSGFTALFDPTSGSAYSAATRTGFSGASFFLGDVGTFKDTVKRPAFDLRDREAAGYIQDNWRATPRLTLNLGLRYEWMPPQVTAGNFAVGFDKNTDSMVLARPLSDMYAANMTTPSLINSLQNIGGPGIGVKFETAQQAGLPPGLIHGKPFNFEPRIGFAYRVGNGLKPFMLRGGWGIYDAQTALRAWDNLMGSGIPYGYPVQYYVSNQALAGVVAGPGVPVNDGLPNFEVRSAPYYVAGVNTRNVLDNPALAQISPGCCALQYMDPQQPPTIDQVWNFSIGREILPGIVATASYVGTHASNLPEQYNFNAAPNDYIWYTATGLAKPTGLYASTGENAYDKTTYGSITDYLKRGYSNANSATIEVQRRYSHGYGFQFSYVMTDAFTESTLVGNGGGTTLTPASTYMPGAVPTNLDTMNRFLNYVRDTAIPHHQLKWNWVADLPFGREKLLASNAGKVLNTLIGGWQIAGSGSYQSRYWSLPTTNFGSMGQVQMYGTKYPIQDCSSGQCVPGYLYWNGYISPPLINRTDASGKCTGICGIPSNYTPSNLPLIPYGATALPANAPANTNLSTYWETQTAWVKLQDGSVVRTTYNTNLNPWRNQFEPAPWTFNLSASLFKTIPLSEAVKLRFNADFFQVLNNPGLPAPGSNGILSTQNSQNSPRDLQLTLRLTW